MVKKISFMLLSVMLGVTARAQWAYDIKVNIKGFKDTSVYLAKYIFDQTYIVDTCKKVKNGSAEFRGKEALDKGVYIFVTQEKSFFFEFLVNESEKLTITADVSDIAGTLNAPGNTENQKLFSYGKYTSLKNKDFNDTRLTTAGKSKEDSLQIMRNKVNELEEDVKKFDVEYMQQIKGTFLYDFFNLKMEKTAPEIPKAKNGRPDSVYQYYYYKSHYFDGVNFKDERIARTPSFDDRIKKYFDNVILNNPDTVIQEIDKLLARCDQGNLNYIVLITYFTHKYEQTKVIGFDKVFLHLIDNYILAGKTKGMYSTETMKLLEERSKIMTPLLEGKIAQELYMIDTLNARQVRKLGFDTASSVKSITDLYYKNEAKLKDLFVRLHDVNAKYTVLLFWAADCGHCQKEVPKLHESLKQLKGIVDVKVYAVETKDDQFDPWRHFIIDHKLSDFINVYDPVHLNNVKEKFDVTSTPLIYILDKDKKILTKKIGAEFVADYLKAMEKQEKERKP